MRCTGVAASWCPVHGDCTCPEPETPTASKSFDDPSCPLHSSSSSHADVDRPCVMHPADDCSSRLPCRDCPVP